MVQAGVSALVSAFGGQTEGENRFVDFEQTAQQIFHAMHRQMPESQRATVRRDRLFGRADTQ
jgi:hypothetical protein